MNWLSDRVLLAIAVVWLAANVSPRWYPTPDSAGYLSVARELADTGRLRNLDSPHIYYPVGYSLLVAPAFLVADEPFLLIALLHFALAVALLALVYRWVREIVPAHAAWVALLTVANTSFGHIYRRTLGETAFMVAWMLAGVCLSRLLREGPLRTVGSVDAALVPAPLVEGRSVAQRPGGESVSLQHSPLPVPSAPTSPQRGEVEENPTRRGWITCSPWWVLAAALALIPLVLLRPAGAMIAGGFVVGLGLAAWRKERSWRTACLCALVVVPAAAVQLAWMTRDRLAAEEVGSITYSEQFRDPAHTAAEQVVEGLRLRIQETGRLLTPGMFRSYARRGEWLNVNMLVFVPVTAGVLVGWWAAVRRHRDVHLGALPFYVGLYVLWPHDQTTRFFTPVLPMLLACVLTAVRHYPPDVVRRAAVAFAALHLGVALGFWLLDERRQNDRLMAKLPDLREVAAEVPPDDRGRVAISAKCQDQHPLLSFLLNRPVRLWTPKEPPAESVRWLVVDELDPPPAGFHPAGARRLWRK